jgi:hypothetical protein
MLSIKIVGLDGYFADPEFCNIYHHCLAGVDYAVQCPQQLVWNDKKKMCDWQTSVNCTGRIIPVAQGQTSFCTDKADNKYVDAIYCNVFHHCVGGIDNVVRCDEELQWNDKDKKCDWESKVNNPLQPQNNIFYGGVFTPPLKIKNKKKYFIEIIFIK